MYLRKIEQVFITALADQTVQKAESRTNRSLLLQDWVFRLSMLHIHIPILRVFTTPFPELKRPYLGSFFRVRQVTLPEYGISTQKYWRLGFHRRLLLLWFYLKFRTVASFTLLFFSARNMIFDRLQLWIFILSYDRQ